MDEFEHNLKKHLPLPIDEGQRERIWQRIQSETETPSLRRPVKRRHSMAHVAGLVGAATAACIVVGSVAYLVLHEHNSHIRTPAGNAVQTKQAVGPGRAQKTTIHITQDWLDNTKINTSQTISSNGAWLLVGNHLEDLEGHQYALPADRPYVLDGSAPSGDVLLGYPAGGGGIEVSYDPLHQKVAQSFPLDTKSARTYVATQSPSGTWATLESNSTGAGPTTYDWISINGTPLQRFSDLRGLVLLAWSPTEDVLAITTQDAQNMVTTLLNPVTGQQTQLSSRSSTSPPAGLAYTQVWSPDGTMVGVQDGSDLFTLSPGKSSVMAGTDVKFWGWISPTQLFEVTTSGTLLRVTVAHSAAHAGSAVTLPYSVQAAKAVGNGIVLQAKDGSLHYLTSTGKDKRIAANASVWWTHGTDVYFVKNPSGLTVWRTSISLGGGAP